MPFLQWLSSPRTSNLHRKQDSTFQNSLRSQRRERTETAVPGCLAVPGYADLLWLQVFKCCIQAIGRIGEGGILRLVTLLEPCFQACPAGSLEVLTTAVGYIDRGWTLLPEKLGHMLYLVAHAIFPQLQARDRQGASLHTHSFCILRPGRGAFFEQL